MKRLLVLIFVLIFSTVSCKDSSSDYAPYVKVASTKYGIVILGNKTPGIPSIQRIDKALDIFVKHCKTLFPEEKCLLVLKNIKIEWWGVIAPSPSTGSLSTVVVYQGQIYSGLATLGDYKARVAWRGLIGRSAFAHEIIHLVGYFATGDPDGEHKKAEWWALVGEMKKEMIENNL